MTSAKSSEKRGSTLTGNAGEYYVMAELLKRGIVAALAPRNAPDFDILATNGTKTVRIRVKTKSEQTGNWQWSAKGDGEVFRNVQLRGDFVVFVHLAAEVRNVAYYIAKTARVAKWVRQDFREWLESPGKRGRPHDPNNKLRCLSLRKYQKKMSTDWRILWE